MNSKLSYAIAALLGGASFGSHATESASTDANTDADALAAITVTAQRRSENVQDVPISIQVLTAQSLGQLNVSTFDDYIKYLPNISASSSGPGQSEIYMRGLSTGSAPSQGSGSTAIFPNVALYLDNQSAQLPSRNLDIYAADLERIEVLEGPQGTLFGAGAEAGVIRYITNQPKLDVTEGSVKAGYGVTAHGDPNSDVTAVLNVPLIPETLAVRAVIYDDSRGGYINNVPGTFTRRDTDAGIHYANYAAVNGKCPDGQRNNGFCVPPGSPVLNNNNLVANAINPVTYQGIRGEALYEFNDDWNVLLTQSYQSMNSEGVFYQYPKSSDGVSLQPLEVTLFNPTYDNDRFENTALTINGRIGELKAVYTGGYLVRNIEQTGDYTNYARAVYAEYYQCYGPGSGGNAKLTSTCFSPSQIWHSVEKNEHLQQEFRLSTPDEWRLRGIVGAFYENSKVYDQTDFRYKTAPTCTSNGPPGSAGNSGCFATVGTIPGTTVQNPGPQTVNSAFYEDDVRDTIQTAFFASFDFDLIPKVLTVTAGTRHFLFENSLKGSVSSSFGCFQGGVPAGGCYNPNFLNLDARNLRDTESGFKNRANITYHVTPDLMVYYTFSQGFRPGGFNQSGGALHAPGPDGVSQFAIPSSYSSDELTNNEIGWKTEFLDHHFQWNGALYREKWNNVQLAFINPGEVGDIIFNTNGQNYLIQGVETSLVARVVTGLTLQGAASWNRSKQTNSPALMDNNPASVNFGKPITEVCTSTSCTPVGNPYGPIGAPTPNSPPIQFSLRARYEWTFAEYSPFIQLGANHVGHSFSQSGEVATSLQAAPTGKTPYEIPAYSTFDASMGIAKGAWTVTAYGQNLGNSNASTFISGAQYIVAQTPLRPRVLGMSFGYKF